MKTKVIKSDDKNFEEEKVKMFEPKQLTKEEQLKITFKKMITNFLNSDFDVANYYHTQDDDIETLANNLILEVKIRTKL